MITEEILMRSNPKNNSCIDCAAGACDGKTGTYPEFCITCRMKVSPNLSEDPEGNPVEDSVSSTDETLGQLREDALQSYLNDPEDRLIARASAAVEFEGYGVKTRVEEICDFADKIGARQLGIATCVGLLAEARIAAKIFRHHGFEVYGVACKAGAVPKTQIGLDPEFEKLGPHICNPILQAKILNEKKTDLNIVIGLCVGHDSLFYKYSNALCTTLITKDRVLGHNPAAALYQTGSYYSRLLK